MESSARREKQERQKPISTFLRECHGGGCGLHHIKACSTILYSPLLKQQEQLLHKAVMYLPPFSLKLEHW